MSNLVLADFYAYLWLRENRTPYYVGKGHGDRAFVSSKHNVHRPKDRSRIVVISCRNEQEAFDTEKNLILNWGRKDLGTGVLYNFTDGGQGQSGAVISQERRARQAAKVRGRPSKRKGMKVSEETRLKIKQAKSFISEETRKRMSIALTGRKNPHTKEWDKKISDGQKRRAPETWLRGPANPFFGKKHSPESLAKMSAANIGVPKPQTPEHSNKIRRARIEYWKKLQAAGLNRRVWTRERDAEVATLYGGGLSQRKIAQKFSANRQTVRESLRRTGSLR